MMSETISNPFFYGNPVPSDQFLGRRRELRRITSRIVNQGQSTAVVGEPRSGKTSLLEYLAAPEKRDDLYGSDGERLVFSFIDNQALGGQCNQTQFWELALHSLHERVIAPDPNSSLAQAYRTGQENAFGTFTLERLLAQMKAEGWRLALLLDEFDVLLYHPVLSCAEFFGGLRALASRSRGALALVIASRRSLTSLNEATQQFSHTGSPYFNFLSEVTLGPLPDKHVAVLLRRAGDRFTPDDRRFIEEVAGGHPYLLQAAAYELWEAYEEGEEDPNQRRQQAGQHLYDETVLTLGNIWQLWSPETRQAFTAVALAHAPTLLKERTFDVGRLLCELHDLGPELRSLARQGFVAEDETVPGGWRVRPGAFLWWLTDELVRTVRDGPSFEEWLRKQEWEGLLTRDGKQQLDQGVRAVRGLLKEGAAELIEATAKISVHPIQKLARLMQARQEQGEPPYVLLLGSSLSLTPAVRRAFAGTEDWEAFWGEMQRASLTERKALLKEPLNALGLEPGYQAVAQLAEAGYFDLILTLNVDDAIDDVIRPLSADQSVLLIYDGSNAAQIVEVLSHPTPRIKVVKLRGDMNARKLPLTPQAQFEFPSDLEHAVTQWLSRDTIVVGDLPFDEDVQRCLRSGDEALWCIWPDEPASDSFIKRAKKVRSSGEIITGAGAEFNAFFTALAERLLAREQ